MTAFPSVKKVLLTGNHFMISSLAVCLLKANFQVFIYTTEKKEIVKQVEEILKEENESNGLQVKAEQITFLEAIAEGSDFLYVIALTKEIAEEKLRLIKYMDKSILPHVPIAINSESIALNELQVVCYNPQRLFIANWVEPVHTTFFLEIIVNQQTSAHIPDTFYADAKLHFNKDPYILQSGYSIRSRLLSALVREAFYLIDEGYATVEDIDRACRNDAGYYLPFAGNFRYMDLMGPYAYGLVMKDLNPELSTQTQIPESFAPFFNGQTDAAETRSFYGNTREELDKMKIVAREFSYKIHRLMQQFPFGESATDKQAEKDE